MGKMKMGNSIAEETVPTLAQMFSEVYNGMEGSEASLEYSERHNINSAAVLTVIDDETASLIIERIADRIAGKTVVEIGGGIGLLSLHMGHIAKRVYCIEANPMWSWTFAQVLLKNKPKNVSFLFGSADEFIGAIKADVAVICTHSDIQRMKLVATQFAPTVIDFYSELIAENPAAFDKTAVALRAPDRETIAEAIYQKMPFIERERAPVAHGEKPGWVPGGNSLKQDEARMYADAVLALPSAGAIAGEQQPSELLAQLRAMPSSLNDACRTMELAAEYIEGGGHGVPGIEKIAQIIDPTPFLGMFDLPNRKQNAIERAEAVIALFTLPSAERGGK
jgi:hypothetical protein